MKKDSTILSLLGLSQEEISMLLGITRMQWAHFCAGRADIPLSANERLADLIATLQKDKSSAESANQINDIEKKKLYEWLLNEFKTHEFKVLYLERKINTIEEMRKKAFKALEVVTYLEKQSEERLKSLAQSIKNRATNTLKKYSLQHLEALELKKETHQMLKLKFQQKLKF